MNLYLIRHAEAVALGGAIIRDADRPLTERGIEDSRYVGKALGRLDPGITIVLTSPLRRARQTAENIAAALKGHVVPRATERLAPGFRAKALLEELRTVGDAPAVVMIGHQPDLSMAIGHLIDGQSHVSIAMPPGSVARIRMSGASQSAEAHLQWLLTPELLRSVVLQGNLP
jgi:phosphohistidine phosphatase